MECSAGLDPGTVVRLDFGIDGPRELTVRWANATQMGLQFSEPFDMTSLAVLQPKPKTNGMMIPTYLDFDRNEDGAQAQKERVTPRSMG